MINSSHAVSELSAESVEILRSLIGKTVHTLYASTLSIAGAHVTGRAISKLIARDEFLSYDCVWSETPHFLMDSWDINVRATTIPTGVSIDTAGALLDPSTIRMWGATPIEKIDVFSFHDEQAKGDIQESVTYDGMLLFSCQDNQRFVIGCQLHGPGIAEDMHFSQDETVIGSMTDSGSVRISIA